jgi:hypothetical protein
MDNETKGKLIDTAIVTAKIGWCLTITGLMGGRGALLPRPVNMWRNQRASREYNEKVLSAVASGSFRYCGYQAIQSENGTRWAFYKIGEDHLLSYTGSGEECIRQIDRLIAGKTIR